MTSKNTEIQDFKNRFHGDIFLQGDTEYNSAREIWNRLVDRHPFMIARCRGAADVVKAIKFAREHELEVAIKGGGHHVAGHALCDNGLAIDLSPMKGIRVDPVQNRVLVQTGLTWADFDSETQTWGLACTGPIVSMTGVSGFTLGGGYGWLHRKLGLACDNLISADIVTAEGNLLHANAQCNPDLFWALRGGGGNFGVVTAMELQLHQIGPQVVAGLVYFPLDSFLKLADFHQNYVASAPDELMTCFVLRKAPPHPTIPQKIVDKPVVAISFCYCGNVDEGKKWAEQLIKFQKPIANSIRPVLYTEFQKSLDSRWDNGFYNDWRSLYLDELTPKSIAILSEYLQKVDSPWTDIKIFHLEGAVNRIPENATAFGNRKARFILVIQSRWERETETEKNLDWSHKLLQALTPLATSGAYSNFLAEDEANRIPEVYGANYERLREIKQRYDPENFFHFNTNIKPIGW